MPVQSCKQDNKPGFKWGSSGKCFTFNPNDPSSRNRARRKAQDQGAAIEISKKERK